MSRSNPNQRAVNPAKLFLQWDSDKKQFKHWDKEAVNPEKPEKKGANVFIPIPFNFLVLDSLHTIAGFSDENQSGIYSNEVRDLKKEKLKIYVGKTAEAEGLYEDIKGKVVGSKYAQSIYIGFHDADGSLQIANLKLYGASIGSWIEFCKKNDVEKGAINVSETRHGKKGKVEWDEPIFKAIEIKPETDEKAKELDVQLQEYLTAYLDRAASTTEEATAEPATEPAPAPVASESFAADNAVDEPTASDLPF